MMFLRSFLYQRQSAHVPIITRQTCRPQKTAMSIIEEELEEEEEDDHNEFNVAEQVTVFMSSQQEVEGMDPETVDEVQFCSQASTRDELKTEIKVNSGCGCTVTNHYQKLDASVIFYHIQRWHRYYPKFPEL